MERDPRIEVSQLLVRIGQGEAGAAELMPVLYAELRSIADRLMRSERADHTLQPTALVHEAFVRLFEGEAVLGQSRNEFLAVAARAMRNLLVDHARRHLAEKRGGGAGERVTLSGLGGEPSGGQEEHSPAEILDLHEALSELEELDERQARIVEMCYFAGMSGQEIAEQLGLHRNSVVRELQMARAWLRRRTRPDVEED